MSNYPTIIPSNLKGYQQLTFEINQSGTNHPTATVQKGSMKTDYSINPFRISTGKFVFTIPNASKIMGAGLRACTKDRLVQCAFNGTQLEVYNYKLVNPNTNGGLYVDGLKATVTIFFKPIKPFRRFTHYSASYLVGFKLSHPIFNQLPRLTNAFSTFNTRIGVVSQCEILSNNHITKSRYLIKGLGSLLHKSFMVSGMSLTQASTNFYFSREGNDLVIGVNALESIDDDTTWQLAPSQIGDAMFFIQFSEVVH